MRHRTQPLTRQGFTLIELLVVISIIAILAGMLIPAIGMVQANANRQKSGKNMEGIVAGLITYSTDNGGWPRAVDENNEAITGLEMSPDNAENAHLATVAAFYLLAANYRADISNKLFLAPKSQTQGPIGKPEKDEYTQEDIEAWGWTGQNMIPYAFDWSASSTPQSNRAWLGDRGPDNIDLNKAMLCFGDGHREQVDIEEEPSAGNYKSRNHVNGGNDDVTAFSAFFTGHGEGIDSGDSASDDGTEKDSIWDSNGDYDGDGDETQFLFKPGRGNEVRIFLK